MPLVEVMSFDVLEYFKVWLHHIEVFIDIGEYFESQAVGNLSYRMLEIDYINKQYTNYFRQMFSEVTTLAKFDHLINRKWENFMVKVFVEGREAA